jgi:hypothetical protein
MTEAEIKRYLTADPSAHAANLSATSVEYDGVEAWNISMRCPRCGEFSFKVRECGDTSIQDQIKSQLRTHAAAH